MQSYIGSSSDNGYQPLDFTSKSKIIEPPILDLSCKKLQQQDNKHSLYGLSPVSLEIQSLSSSREATSPSNDNNSHQSRQISYDHERKSPIEVRTFMVTPPSESDSPKKPKFHSMYPKLNLLEAEIPPRHSRLNTNIPLHISPLSSNRLAGEHMSQHYEHTSSPATTTTTTTINTVPLSHRSVSVSEMSPEPSKKGPRPFKAYPKDPLSMSIGSAELVHDPTSNEAYNEFRKRMLESVRKTNEGTNIKMRRVCKSPTLPTSTMDDKDAAYWERRRKNNEAAKRSRDARRAKEDEIAIRAAFLEQENIQLKCELVALRNETAKLRCMIFTN